MTKYALTFLFIISTLIANAQFSEPFAKIKVKDDTWVGGNEPDKNHEGETGMSCSWNDNPEISYMVYLKFDLSGMPECDSVNLSFIGGFSDHEGQKTPVDHFFINLVILNDTSWNESEITWNNRPTEFGEVLAEVKMLDGSLYYDFASSKLSKHVLEAKKAGKRYISFVMKGKEKTPKHKVWICDKGWIAPTLEFFYKPSDNLKVEISPSSGCYKNGEIEVKMKANKKSTIYYTLDGSIPSKKSPVYKKPFSIESPTEVNAFAIRGDEKSHYYQEYYSVKKEQAVDLSVDMNSEKGILPNFWNSTGFSPAEILLRADMQQTCDFMGAIPHKGIVYVRPHYLLNLVAAENIHTNTPQYNWTRMDSAMDILIRNDLKPIFEIMGTPSSSLNKFDTEFDKYYQAQTESHATFFTNFYEKEKLVAWKRLIKDMALHFIERYGKEEVRSWYFETCNEPNLKQFWKFSLPEFLNYYDACSEGLKEADPQIRFGGPGSAGALNDFVKTLVAHCDTGTNYFTGEKGVRIDFISVHVKARPDKMIASEAKAIEYIKTNHPRLADVPFFNDESDPIVGWGREYWWRPTPWYAAFVAQSVDYHYRYLIDTLGVNYGIMSNDNAFMGNWYHRTQLARFADPDKPEDFSMVKKPCFTVFSMLSLLGKSVVKTPVPQKYIDHLGIIPTLHADGKIAVMLYNKTQIRVPNKKKGEREDILLACGDETIDLQLQNLPLDNYTLVEYRIDPQHANPYKLWVEMGKPDKPTTEQILQLRKVQEIALQDQPVEISATQGMFSKTIDMPASSVVLLMLLPKTKAMPQKPEALRAYTYSGFNEEKELMLRWNDLNNYYIKTYQIWFSPDNKKYEKINPAEFIDNGYLYTFPKNLTKGYFKVRAVDYWNRNSEFSDILYVE